ncbi:MAG: ammonium transporter, partial [Novosphingobium sp.]|nr:ammonium transporter [Novosphingobium sp.]
VGGMLGALMAAVFMSPSVGGTGYAQGMDMARQLVAQGVGVGVVALWSAVATAIAALMVSLALPMRVTEDDEREGLDLASHGERAWEHD